jgi:Family of unknown function (DUF6325)
MTTDQLDELGTVDYVVVEFPRERANFSGEVAAALADLVDRDLVRILDLLLIRKDADGSITGVEVADAGDDELADLREFEAEVAGILSEEDVVSVAEALEPGSVAGVLVWENRWSTPFASAVRRAGGQLAASGRIPVQAILAALEADEDERDIDETDETDETDDEGA